MLAVGLHKVLFSATIFFRLTFIPLHRRSDGSCQAFLRYQFDAVWQALTIFIVIQVVATVVGNFISVNRSTAAASGSNDHSRLRKGSRRPSTWQENVCGRRFAGKPSLTSDSHPFRTLDTLPDHCLTLDHC